MGIKLLEKALRIRSILACQSKALSTYAKTDVLNIFKNSRLLLMKYRKSADEKSRAFQAAF